MPHAHKFRAAEKKYKNLPPQELLKARGTLWYEPGTSTTDEESDEIFEMEGSFGVNGQVYRVTGAPVEGLWLIRGTLNYKDQAKWLRWSLLGEHLIDDSARTNLNSAPVKDKDRELDMVACGGSNEWQPPHPHSERGLKRLRWATLGYHYHWTERCYDNDDKGEIPEDLKKLISNACIMIEEASSVCMSCDAEVVIVNYFCGKDQMCGHVDKSEDDLSVPIISVSLGCSAIFLCGGIDADGAEPLPILLRSGDILVMSGQSRLCWHGVPAIIPGTGIDPWNDPDITDAELCNVPEIVRTRSREMRVNINARQHLGKEDSA
eukprot:UC4_evm4s488